MTGEKRYSDSRLLLKVAAGQISIFIGLLNAGFDLAIPEGTSVKSFLCDYLGLDENYYNNRIQTLFLNSKPVDDPDTVLIGDGATLALSAAMPGLVGATFRKGGRYSWMRGSITHPQTDETLAGHEGWVTVKLFNLILKELGQFFLQWGVWLPGDLVEMFFKNQMNVLRDAILEVSWGNQKVEPLELLDLKWPKSYLNLTLQPIL